MRVSIVNLNLMGGDAIGQCILNQMRYFSRRGDDARVFTHHPPVGVPADLAAKVFATSLARLAAELDEHFRRSDLYIYHYPARYPLMDTIRGLDRGAVILYYHNVTPPQMWDGSNEDRVALQHSIDSVASLAQYADLIVTPSEYNANQLVMECGLDRETIRVLPLAVDLQQFAPGGKPTHLLERYNLTGKRVLLYVGRLAGNKRVDLLIEALASIRRQIANATLMIVGDNDSNAVFREATARLRKQAEGLCLSDAVVFAGRVEELPMHFRLADVYVSASQHEGFGVPLIEAMASGVPLVVSDAASHPWVVGDAGLICKAGNADALAIQVLRVLSDDDLCGDLVRRGLARARRFSQERYDEGLGQVVAEATAGLSVQPYPRTHALVSGAVAQAPTSPAPKSTPHVIDPAAVQAWRAALLNEVAHADGLSDVMLRGYTVRSQLPLVGGVVAWLRRNMTSHLREPYLDPIVERQVAFNRQMVHLLRHVAEGLPALIRELQSTNGQAGDGEKSPSEAAPPISQLNRIESLLNLMATQITLMTEAGRNLSESDHTRRSK